MVIQRDLNLYNLDQPCPVISTDLVFGWYLDVVFLQEECQLLLGHYVYRVEFLVLDDVAQVLYEVGAAELQLLVEEILTADFFVPKVRPLDWTQAHGLAPHQLWPAL